MCGKELNVKISQKGLYALQSLMTLARQYPHGTMRTGDIALESDLPRKYLELILAELRNARIVDSVRGPTGGYKLRRAPAKIRLSEVVRLIDGPLAPFADAEQLRNLVLRDAAHRNLYQVFLDVRDAAATILEHTSIADIVKRSAPPALRKRSRVGKKRVSRARRLRVAH
jgi:Rrf2 family protein